MFQSDQTSSGPLRGIRVVEFAGLGPAPFACMLLSDMGAEIIRIDRLDGRGGSPLDIVGRGRKTIHLDLKDSLVTEQVIELLEQADVLVEGFRPGVMERLGLGPDVVAQRNPRLVYGRMTGWGQEGPLAQAAGHDINYISLTGTLAAIGERNGKPLQPLNLVGDYGGGSLYLVTGILAALLEARESGRGQVVDAAICDGALSLMSYNQSLTLRGLYSEERGTNVLDGGAPYYTTYETADGKYVSVGPIEPKFFSLLCQRIGVPQELWGAQSDKSQWPQLRDSFAFIFKTRTRDAWCALLEGSDACFAPVLTLRESPTHSHIRARQGFVDIEGVMHTAPAPRFSRTPSGIKSSEAVTSVADLIRAWKHAR